MGEGEGRRGCHGDEYEWGAMGRRTGKSGLGMREEGETRVGESRREPGMESAQGEGKGQGG